MRVVVVHRGRHGRVWLATIVQVLGYDEWRSLPPDDASELDWLLFRQSQVLSREQAVAAIGRSALRNRLAQGRWQRPERAVVVAHNGPLTRAQRRWVAVLAAGPVAYCAGVTAATLEGIRGYDSHQIHLLVPAGRRVHPLHGVTLHRSDVLPVEHTCPGLPPRTVVNVFRAVSVRTKHSGPRADSRTAD